MKHRKTGWMHVVSELMEISAIQPFIDCKKTIETIIEFKKERMKELIEYCRQKEYEHTIAYLENAEPYMFTAIEKRLNGRKTSRVERVMRTVNMRTHVSKWSKTGVVNVNKIRLAYYYNGFDA